MTRRCPSSIVGVTLAITNSLCQAAPMGFKDSWMMMGDFSSNFQELTVNQALTPRDALGLTAIRLRPTESRYFKITR